METDGGLLSDDTIGNVTPGGIVKGTIHSSPQLETTRRMLRVVFIVIELSFEVEKDEGGGGRVD